MCCALALVAASASAQPPSIDSSEFNSALSCRLSKISGGQRSTAAIFEDAPDAINPLRLIRMSAGAAGSELETITPRRSLIVGHVGPIEDKFYWTPNDDLVVWGGLVFLHLPTQGISTGASRRFRITWVGGASLVLMPEHDVTHEHIRTTARIVGKVIDREPLQFEVATGDVSYLPIPVGPYGMVAWTENDEFVRLTKYDSGRGQRYLEVFERATSEWIPLTPAAMPSNSTLVLVRANSADMTLEAVIRWRDEPGVDRIGIVKRGAQRPEVIASDKYMTRVLVSPDRSRIYGFVDLSGRFHRLATETQKPGVAFWLAQLEKKESLEQVYFLSDEKFALIKVRGPVAGPEVQLLERRGNSVAVRHTFCTGGADMARVTEREHSILFVPKGADASKLLVYLHDGPAARVDRGANWLIDLLLASGHPVVAVNYTGSMGREPARAENRGPAEIFGDEIARAIAFARTELHAGEQTVVLVGEGYGALVGFSAIASQRLKPSGFAIVSGLAKSEPILSGFQSGGDTAFGNYGRTAREVRTILDPSAIRAKQPQLEFLFVHGDKDARTPQSDILALAQPLAIASSGRPAVTIIRDMYETPYRRADYDQIAKAIGDFLARQ
jgi:pimeloyl-ACP methyl ester carboxylesterase